MSTLHLGSGGGCDRSGHAGGSGGGAIKIEAYQLELDGEIKANGSGGGCCGSGSGGSIHIIACKMRIGDTAKIEAIGGHSDDFKSGNGRIRLETAQDIADNVLQRISPTPFVG